MKELQDILKSVEQIQNQQTVALATVVSVKGSGYRQPGARMLITPNEQIQGAVSGGCLERDVVEHAKQVMLSSQPRVVTYDTTVVEDDILWGFGQGCQGIIQVLIEPLVPQRLYFPLNIYKNCLSDRQPRAIATITGVEGRVNVNLGVRLVLHSQGIEVNEIEEPDLVSAITSDAQMTLRTECSINRRYQLASGTVEVFIEFIQPPLSLMIFGAGRDAIPLANLAKTLGWDVTIVDCRANEASYRQFLMADRIILTRREKLPLLQVDEKTVAILMTHNYLDDLAILQELLPSSVRYIGVLGSKKRAEQLLQALGTFDARQKEKLYAPVGLDIGANTPEAIAVSIIAEIEAVLNNRSGGFLKDRQGAIHDRFEDVLCPSVS